jgi:hypothetical protein
MLGAREPVLLCRVAPQLVLRLFLLDASAAALAALTAALPGVVRTPLGLEVPLRDLGPEEILAHCLRLGITARATRILESSRPG